MLAARHGKGFTLALSVEPQFAANIVNLDHSVRAGRFHRFDGNTLWVMNDSRDETPLPSE
jgi:hypothetical protein